MNTQVLQCPAPAFMASPTRIQDLKLNPIVYLKDLGGQTEIFLFGRPEPVKVNVPAEAIVNRCDGFYGVMDRYGQSHLVNAARVYAADLFERDGFIRLRFHGAPQIEILPPKDMDRALPFLKARGIKSRIFPARRPNS